MIRIEQPRDGLFILTAEGRIGRDDIDRSTAAVEAARKAGHRISMLADLRKFDGISAEAFIADLRYGLSHLGDLKNYDRIAVVTERDWIEALVWIESKIVTAPQMCSFEDDEMDEAMAFVEGGEVGVKTRPPSITALPSHRPDMLAFAIDGKLREGDVKAMSGLLAEAYAARDRIDLLIRIDDYEGFDPKLLFDRELWSMKFGSFRHLRRYAVVGGPSFVGAATGLLAPLLPIAVKQFGKDDEAQARAWLDEDTDARQPAA